jgi:hypothetical protein
MRYLLLFHKLGIRTVIDNISSKDRRSKLAVDFFRIDILKFTIQDKLIAIDT